MKYNYTNAKLTLNDKAILADSADISFGASLNNVFKADRKNSYDFAPEDGVNGTINLSYTLTGKDPLKDYVYKEIGSISGNFGGLYFSSGYLRNYSLSFIPNTPIQVKASIDFFEGLNGTFTPTFEKAGTFLSLSVADVSLTGCSIGNLDDIESINYSFTADLEPQYIIGEKKPRKIVFKDRKASVDIRSSVISGRMPVEGIDGQVKVTFAHPSRPNYTESIEVNGRITDRSIQASARSSISNFLNITQGHVNKAPIISGIGFTAPLRGGNIVNISGKNFTYIENVLFCINGETTPRAPSQNFAIRSDVLIQAVLPNQTSKGLIEVV